MRCPEGTAWQHWHKQLACWHPSPCLSPWTWPLGWIIFYCYTLPVKTQRSFSRLDRDRQSSEPRLLNRFASKTLKPNPSLTPEIITVKNSPAPSHMQYARRCPRIMTIECHINWLWHVWTAVKMMAMAQIYGDLLRHRVKIKTCILPHTPNS